MLCYSYYKVLSISFYEQYTRLYNVMQCGAIAPKTYIFKIQNSN
ncbi:hypothetical protein B0I22_1505 [Epilithonimonas xixisoli]|uniref:Uncharacterized protein n=1 Tax=Epilithonimonas xixisoli TaxID=1476462 RepID=A0A4R8IB90_9FLAO|nr:hypothetical protein B0I22_1505 [Epilithonimonas xixisoli]